MNKQKIKKMAFTLAETLVTLAVIGVVMALMLRSVNRVSPNKEKLLFIKGYRAIEQAIEESINDQDKYDQAYYTQAQLGNLQDGHVDFRHTPFPDYIANINGETYCSGEGCAHTITQKNAVCVWLAEHINVVGQVSCPDGATGQNFRASNGVCYGDWSNVDANGEVTGYIDPLCDGTTSYKVKIFANGKVTVPTVNNDTVVDWMQHQTELH